MIRFLALCCLLCPLLLTTTAVQAGEGYRDPLVRVSILPSTIKPQQFLPLLSRDISAASGVPESGITVIWNVIPAQQMITGGKLADHYDNRSHPVVVELFLAGFFAESAIQETMAAIADSFAEHTPVAREQVFILTTLQQSGQVYVFGKPLQWQQGENPFK
ncbi:hypothetical protein [Desulfogranum mediterraneum]|uniref:hypothetical protein n=1 Tax=Desulfogranum mediterraneum TaxID=160661 RepID=UPI00041797C0|nr:hypothetical protein [Desulfogranum mediterraneum]